MRRLVIAMAALGLALGLLAFAGATQAGEPTHPRSFQDEDKEKEQGEAYRAWYDANQARDIPKAYDLAKSYLAKYPDSENAKYLKMTWLPQIRGYLFNEAMKAKNTGEMLKIGREALSEDPEQLDYIYLLAVNLRQNEVSSPQSNMRYATEVVEFTEKAIQHISQGKVPGVVDKEKWQQNVQLGYLYQTLAIVEEHRKNNDAALSQYKKAASLDPGNPTFLFACGRLHQAKYLEAVKKYQDFPEEDRENADEKPDVKAALDEANRQADAVIDCWARFVAASADKSEYSRARGEVEKVLNDLYTYRHPDDPEGLRRLIERYKTDAPPAEAASNNLF